MNKKNILQTVITALDAINKINGVQDRTPITQDTILTLSSIDFIDLIIDIETRLDITLPDSSMKLSKISIRELVEEIEKHA